MPPAINSHPAPSSVHHFMHPPNLAIPHVSSRGFSPPLLRSSSRTPTPFVATPAEDHQ
jgi:hypothetical protein